MVISIISVLIGILLPVLPKVRDAARRTACGADLRSIGQAIELYKNDYEEVFPVARYMPRPWLSGDTDPALDRALSEYLDPGTEVWVCPGDDDVASAAYTDDNGQPATCDVSFTYLSGVSGQQFEDTFFYDRLKFGPGQTPVAYDFDGGTFETESGDLVQVGFFHTTRNLLFADGSVGEYKLK